MRVSLGEDSGTASGAGFDTLRGIECLTGSRGDDTLAGSERAERIRGNLGADWIAGGDGADTLSGGSGDDMLFGDGGNDRLRGDAGDNALFGGDGDDRLIGIGGFETLDGGDGNDALFGFGRFGNNMYGGEGSDRLTAGYGDDTMNGGPGRDSFIRLGRGFDVFVFDSVADSPADAPDIIFAFKSQTNNKSLTNPNPFVNASVIDVSAIDADETLAGQQSFEFGTEPGGSGRLWAVDLAGSSRPIVQIRGETDGLPGADFAIDIIIGFGFAEEGQRTASDVTADDFIL